MSPPLRIVAEPEPPPVALDARADDDLVLLARAGKSAAFDVLVRRHQAQMLRVAAKYTGSVALAKDVTQNAFIEVFRYLPRYQPQGRFRFFLYRVLMNQCHMHHRTLRPGVEVSAALVDAAALPDEVLLQAEKRKIVDAAVLDVNDKLREVLLLRFTADMPLADIAEVLQVPVGTVKSRLFAALAVLRETLAKQVRP